jgi:hypothetical protein
MDFAKKLPRGEFGDIDFTSDDILRQLQDTVKYDEKMQPLSLANEPFARLQFDIRSPAGETIKFMFAQRCEEIEFS